MSAPVFGRHSSYRNDIHVVSRYLKLSFIELCMHHSFDIWSYVLQRRHNVLQRKILEAWPLYANINDSSGFSCDDINDFRYYLHTWFSLLSSHKVMCYTAFIPATNIYSEMILLISNMALERNCPLWTQILQISCVHALWPLFRLQLMWHVLLIGRHNWTIWPWHALQPGQSALVFFVSIPYGLSCVKVLSMANRKNTPKCILCNWFFENRSSEYLARITALLCWSRLCAFVKMYPHGCVKTQET